MNVAFDVVFGVFVALILALAVVAIRWGVRRDRLARSRWSEPTSTTPEGGVPVTPGSASEEPTT